MTIDLIRHGKTLANEQHLYCGATDLPLSEAGAAALSGLSYSAPPDCRFLTSGMKRCNDTLTLLFGPVPYTTEPAFREMDFGAFEMRSYEDLKNNPAYQAWITGNNEENVTPGGESGLQMRDRALSAFGRLAAQGQNAVLITHGGIIAAIMASLFPQEHRNRYQWQPAPGKGYHLTYANSAWSYHIAP